MPRAWRISLSHRGPDDRGVWIDAEAGVALGHTRLAIIDLSPAGAQPMISSCGRFVLSYNGEIYNAPELRAELEQAGRAFRGHSDTEVMVEGFAVWGVRPTVERLIGMFAFAAWDRSTHTLTLGRDRLGIKPLYWGRVDDNLVFASELKALTAFPGWQAEIDRDALAAFLRYGYVPTPMSIYRGIRKLAPGTLLECGEDGEVRSTAYWSLAEVAARGQATPLDVSDGAAQEAVESLLADAVRRRMVADVPLGMFLSGGIDSSTIAALMQANSARPIRTFSIGFREPAYDEAAHAKKVASHLGTEHTELYVTPAEAQAVIPKLPHIYDEPFADSSQIPTYLVSEMTRRHVTVALSGDGGDEVFAGYNRYGQGLALAKAIAPSARRHAIGPCGCDHRRPARASGTGCSATLPSRIRPRLAGEKMHKFAGVLPKDMVGFYQSLVTQCDEADHACARGRRERCETCVRPRCQDRFADDVSWMQYLDTLHLSARRHFDQGRSRQHGGGARGARSASRSPRGGAFMAVAAAAQAAGRDGQMAVAADRLQICAEGPLGAAEDGLRRPDRRMAEGSAQGVGGRSSQPGGAPRCGIARARTDRREMGRASGGDFNRQHFLWNVLMFAAWHDSIKSPETSKHSQAVA